MTTKTLRAPEGRVGIVQTEFGNYQIDANGFVTVDSRVTSTLLNAGFSDPDLEIESQPISGNGLVPASLPLLAGFCQDGAPIAAAAAAGDFGVALTPGTSFYLVGEAAQNNTKTDIVEFLFTLPPNYEAGEDLTVTINAGAHASSGTVGTKTLDLSAYEQAADGTQGSDLVTTTIGTLPTIDTDGDLAFAIDGENLAPGDTILLVATMVIQETMDGGTVTGHLNSVIVS